MERDKVNIEAQFVDKVLTSRHDDMYNDSKGCYKYRSQSKSQRVLFSQTITTKTMIKKEIIMSDELEDDDIQVILPLITDKTEINLDTGENVNTMAITRNMEKEHQRIILLFSRWCTQSSKIAILMQNIDPIQRIHTRRVPKIMYSI